jgi:hypothetical protein
VSWASGGSSWAASPARRPRMPPRRPGSGNPACEPPAPMPVRSKCSVVWVTAQPLPSPPMRSAPSTTASLRKISLKTASPVISRSGLMVTPGWSNGKANQEMPRCLGTSKLVRASSMPKSAPTAWLDQTFCPLMTQRSPSRSARVVKPARSEPAPGSLKSWHQAARPSRMGGTKRWICSGVPCVRMVGAAIKRPRPPGGRNAPNDRKAERTTDDALRPRPRPPSWGVKCGAVQPASATFFHQSSTGMSGSQLADSQSWTSAQSSA